MLLLPAGPSELARDAFTFISRSSISIIGMGGGPSPPRKKDLADANNDEFDTGSSRARLRVADTDAERTAIGVICTDTSVCEVL